MTQKHGENFGRRLAVVQRRDERLKDRDGAVIKTHIPPGFEEVCFGNMPLTQGARLVVIEADVNTHGGAIDACRERRIGGRRVSRVAAEDEN